MSNYPAGSDNEDAPWNRSDSQGCDFCGEKAKHQARVEGVIHDLCDDCVPKCGNVILTGMVVSKCEEPVYLNDANEGCFCRDCAINTTHDCLADAVKGGDAEEIAALSADMLKLLNVDVVQ